MLITMKFVWNLLKTCLRYNCSRRRYQFWSVKPLTIISCILICLFIYQTSNTKGQRNIECNGGYLLLNRVRKYSRFIADLNNSFPRQFDSGIMNFSYTYDHTDQTKIYEEHIDYNFLEMYTRFSSIQPRKTKVKYRGYIAVMGVGQELSQCTKHVLRLCFLANMSERKVVAPRMSRGRMRWVGKPFEEFFNLLQLNKQLLKFRYSEIATQEEYLTNCKNERKTLVIVFYDLNTSTQGVVRSENLNVYRQVLESGWIECSKYVIEGYLDLNPQTTDYYCVHYTIFQSIAVFNQKILRDSKCTLIPQWNELGDDWWNITFHQLRQSDLPKPRRILHWFALPSREIVDEVNSFQTMSIQRPYVAIHIRGVKFKNRSLIQPCFDVALEFVNALKRTRKVKTLFLSTDMSRYGGYTNQDKVTHQLLAEQSGAVIYDPRVTKRFKRPDMWQVSLAEMRLMSQSDHLITIGHGSFNVFTTNRFNVEHVHKTNWTWTTLCHETSERYQ